MPAWQRGVVKTLASGFGLGFLPKAPGTWGSLLGLPIAFALAPAPWGMAGAILTGLTAVAVAVASLAERAFGTHDAKHVVIDEIVGIGWTFWGVSCGPLGVALGFVLFRLLDALKPGPIGWMDRTLPGGWGVVIDDVAAGLAACGLLHAVMWVWPVATTL